MYLSKTIYVRVWDCPKKAWICKYHPELIPRDENTLSRFRTGDEVGDLAEFLMSSRGRFISGADLLIDGGCTASYWYGDLQYLKATH